MQKQPVAINFGQGVSTKVDPFQVPAGKFLAMQNSVFDVIGQLKKRYGFPQITALPNGNQRNLTTYQGNLIALGPSLYAFNGNISSWKNTGSIYNVQLSIAPQVRTSTSQTTVDCAVHSSGLACSAWLDSDANSYYQISDSITSQIVIAKTQLPATATMPRAFVLGNYFVVTFLVTISATPHLQYVAIPVNNAASPVAATDLSTQVLNITTGYDGYVANNNLYVAWNGSDGGGAIRATYIDSTLAQHNTIIIAGKTANLISVTADISGSNSVIWISAWNNSDNNVYTFARSQTLVSILASTTTVTNNVLRTLTSTATGNVLTLLYEISQNYTYVAIPSDFIRKVTCTITGTVGTPSVIKRGVGLASKSFIYNSIVYVLVAYSGALQPTYFLMDSVGNLVAKVAYQNGGGLEVNQILPGVTILQTSAYIGYLFKDQLTPVNKSQGVVQVAGIYSAKGINLAKINFTSSIQTVEIANNLHLNGGFLWMFDGVAPVEHGFHVYPENVVVTTNAAGGNLTDQQYYYIATYEWTDAQGNLHRSAPSAPVGQVTAGGGVSTNTIKVPTLRLTSKTGVRIVLYRWSAGQQVYYQISSITTPTLNDTSVDNITYTDTAADSSILGNVVLYTTGGVVENIAAPAMTALTLYKTRLIGVAAEDTTTFWYSKPVLQATPVEMSDLFVQYTAPTASSAGSTGGMKAVAPMDDKLIIFKDNALYYITGQGPDSTGASNDFSEPVFITSTVGSSIPQSIVLTPNGLMFQSNKGIWLLSRGLQTEYIGADVESFTTNAIVESAITVPGTNQVRFTLDSGVTLMYDYFVQQWGTFNNIPAVSSTIYENQHTYINSSGLVFQQNPLSYLDGSNPVLQTFTTSWFNLAGLQGFQRAYFFYLLGTYLSPHKLNISIAYDYNPSPAQSFQITPDNNNSVYGEDPLYGNGNPYGGKGNLEQWRVFMTQQKCESFQITIAEVFDASQGMIAGAGLTLSGLNIIVGMKKAYTTLNPSRSAS